MNFAIIGAGAVVSGILEAYESHPDISAYAICGLASDRDHMEELRKRFGIEKIFYDYARLLQDEQIDVIHLAIPNRSHYEYASRAIQAYKNVIIEKPFAHNYQCAEKLVKLAKQNDVFVFEAISNQYFSTYQMIKEWLPLLGDLKIVSINYSAFSKRYTAFHEGTKLYPCFDLKNCGDVMTDMGIYCLHFAIGLFGRPDRFIYIPNMEKGVDTSGNIILVYPGFLCSMICSKDSRGDPVISIQGSDGFIGSHSYVNDPVRIEMTTYEGYDIKEHRSYEAAEGERFLSELRYFIKMVKEKDYQKRDKALDHSLSVIEIMEDCLHQIGIHF